MVSTTLTIKPLVLYVDANAVGAKTGVSWTDAYPSLADALSASIAGQTIRVADGTYKPTTSTIRSIAFKLKKGVAIYGGYAGFGAEDPNARNIALYPSILSGDIGAAGVKTDNSYNVVTTSSVDATAILDGFTITAGFNDYSTLSDSGSGAGIYNDSGSPTLRDCVINDNFSMFNGGGMFNKNASPTLIRCVFKNNCAKNGPGGGGMYNQNSRPVLVNCFFASNTAMGTSGRGGGMYNAVSSCPTITNTVFVCNESSMNGAGVYCYSDSPSITLTNSTLAYNYGSAGNALEVAGPNATTVVTNCVLWGLYATTSDVLVAPGATITYSIVRGGFEGAGNIDSDPLFIRNPGPGFDNVWGTADDDYGDLRLRIQSKAIDAGKNAAVPDGVTTDFAGNARFIDVPGVADTGVGTPPIVDIGAYEAISEVIANAGGPYSVDKNKSITLNGAGSGSVPGDLVYEWEWTGDGKFDDGFGPNPVFNTTGLAAGDRTITLRVTDPASQTATATTTLSIETGYIYVDPSATGAGTGKNWKNAIASLADALVIANSGSEIHVADGIYKPTTSTDRTLSFTLKNGVAIYGGYGGYGALNPDARDFTLYPSILSGDIGSINSNYDNSYHVVTAPNTNSTAILDGFTISNGNADSSTVTQGGGMYIKAGSPTINDCIFKNNEAYIGGGLYVENSSSMTLSRCTFTGNSTSSSGKGIYLYNTSPTLIDCVINETEGWYTSTAFYNSSSSPTLTRCIFKGNYGSGLYNLNSSPSLADCVFKDNNGSYEGSSLYNNNSSPTLSGCSFTGNKSSYGSAIYNNNKSSPNLINCSFAGNSVSMNGGAVYNNSSSAPSLTNCTFSSNSASSDGGAIYNNASSPTLTNCTFSSNSASDGGSIYNYKNSSPTLTNCSFASNSASSYGGAIYNDNTPSTSLTGCAFTSNKASSQGGAIYNYKAASTSLSGCSFTGNSSSNYGGAIYNYDYTSTTLSGCSFTGNSASYYGGAIYNDNYTSATLTGCAFTGNSASSSGGAIYNDYYTSFTLAGCAFTSNSASSKGGAIYNYYYSTSTYNTCTFIRNSSSEGAALYNEDSSLTAANCSFLANKPSSSGSAIYCYDSQPVSFSNCLFVGMPTQGKYVLNLYYTNAKVTNSTFINYSASNNSTIYCDYRSNLTLTNSILWGSTSPISKYGSSSTVTATFNDIQGGYVGTGNINAEPKFIRNPGPGPDNAWGTNDDDYGDLRLQCMSPAIDAGNNSAVPTTLTTDFAGSPRFMDVPARADTGSGTAPIVDMGAYEAFPPSAAIEGGPYTIALNSSLNLHASGSSNAPGDLAFAWEWTGDNKFDDAVGQNPVFAYSLTPGAINAVLRVTDSLGNSGYASVVINVLPPTTATLTPANNAIVPAAPTTATVVFSNPILTSSLDASDLKVDGIPCTAYSVTDDKTVVFTLPSLAGGTHQFTIASGDILDILNTPVVALSSSFTIDLSGPRVIASSIQEGDIASSGAITFSFTFDRPMKTSNLSNSGFTLRGRFIDFGYLESSYGFSNDNTVLTINYKNLPDDQYTLTLRSYDGWFEDVNGCNLDGEPNFPIPPNKSGNGVAGGNFVVNFTMDDGSIRSFPTPLTAVNPAGSQVYTGSVNSSIANPSDKDSYTINLDAGQVLTVVAHTTSSLFKPAISLSDSNGLLASAIGVSENQDAIIQTFPITAAGTYTITVSSDGVTSGLYTLQLLLNAAIEVEDHGGAANDTPATAQSLDGNFKSVSGDASIASVVGKSIAYSFTEDFEAGVLGSGWTTYGSATNARIQVTGSNSTASGNYAMMMDARYYGTYNLNEAVWTVNLTSYVAPFMTFSSYSFSLENNDPLPASFTGHYNGDGVSISADGNTWYTVWTNATPKTWTSFSVDLAAAAASAGIALGNNFKIKFQQYGNDHTSSAGRGYDKITIASPNFDYYSLNLNAGQHADLALARTSGTGMGSLQIYNAQGALLASSSSSDSNAIASIRDFTASDTGKYFIKATLGILDYNLVVTRDCAFNLEPNSSIPQPLDNRDVAVGSVSAVPIGTVPPTNAGSVYTGSLDLGGSRLYLGFAPDGSFIGSRNGAYYNGTEFLRAGIALGSFTVSVGGSNFTNSYAYNASSALNLTLRNISSGSMYGIRAEGTINSILSFQRTIWWNGSDDNVLVFTTLANIGSSTLGNIALLDNLNPNPGGAYSTNNDVNIDNSGRFVTAGNGYGYMGLGSIDSRAVPSAGNGVFITNPWPLINSPTDPNGALSDTSINMAFNIGALAPGQSTTAGYAMVFSTTLLGLNNRLISISPQTLLGAPDDDQYSLSLIAGHPVILTTTTPSDGPNEYANTLDPVLELYDAAGNLVASNNNGAPDGRNALLAYKPAATGLYTLKISAASGTFGDYVLNVKKLNPAPADLLPDCDTGLSNADNITHFNNSSPEKALRFQVPSTPGSTVNLYADGLLVASANATGTSTLLTLDGAATLPDGIHAFTTRLVAPGGVSSDDSAPLNVQIISATPDAPSAPDLQPSSDNGLYSDDNITNIHTPTFNISAAPYYRFYRDGVQISGDYESNASFTDAFQPDGAYNYAVAAVDAAGNISAHSPVLPVIIDSGILKSPDLASFCDSGASDSDNITFFNGDADRPLAFTLSNIPANVLLTLYANGIAVGSALSDGGDVEIVVDSAQPLADGTYLISVRQQSPGQPQSHDSDPLTLVIDTAAPQSVQPDLQSSSDSGPSDSDNITSDTTPSFDVASPNYILFRNGVLVSGPNASGTYTSPALADGTYVFSAIALDAAGNMSPLSSLSVTIDTKPPKLPASFSLDPSSDSGASNSDNITNIASLTFNLSGAAYYRVYENSNLLSGLYHSASTFTLTVQSDGSHLYQLYAVDAAGNQSVGFLSSTVLFDTIAPSSAVSTLPLSNSTNDIAVTWSGADNTNGAGLANFDIYVSDNGADPVLWLDHATSLAATYTGQFGHLYSFYSLARDVADNLESLPDAHDAQTIVLSTWEGTDAADEFALRLDPTSTGQFVQFFNSAITPDATPVFTFPLNIMQSFSIDGKGGDDRLTLDFSNGNPVPAAGLTLQSPFALNIVGTPEADVINLTESQLAFNSMTLPLTHIQSVSLNTAAGDDIVNLNASFSLPYSLNLGAGDNTLNQIGGNRAYSSDLGATDSVALNLSSSAVASFGAIQHLRNLNIAEKTTAKFVPGLKAALFADGLVIGGAGASLGKLDLADSDLVVNYTGATPYPSVRPWMLAGIVAGRGVFSSTTSASNPTILGMVDNARLHKNTWNGFTVSDGSDYRQLLARKTLLGDVNLDGKVDSVDEMIIFANLNHSNATYFQGDINYGGSVTLDDLAIVQANLGANMQLTTLTQKTQKTPAKSTTTEKSPQNPIHKVAMKKPAKTPKHKSPKTK